MGLARLDDRRAGPLTTLTGFAILREFGSRQSICFPQNWQNSPSFLPNCFPQCGHLLKRKCGIKQETATMTPTRNKGSEITPNSIIPVPTIKSVSRNFCAFFTVIATPPQFRTCSSLLQYITRLFISPYCRRWPHNSMKNPAKQCSTMLCRVH